MNTKMKTTRKKEEEKQQQRGVYDPPQKEGER